MKHDMPSIDDSSARALALIVAANGRIKECELEALAELDAFERLNVSREHFVDLAESCLSRIGTEWCTSAWLHLNNLPYIDALLDGVRPSSSRLMVCRLAVAVMVADDKITDDERIMFMRALGRWNITKAMVTRAIMNDRVH